MVETQRRFRLAAAPEHHHLMRLPGSAGSVEPVARVLAMIAPELIDRRKGHPRSQCPSASSAALIVANLPPNSSMPIIKRSSISIL